MSNQSHQPAQNTLAPSALRQGMLDQMNASQEAIQALSDEELEGIAGGLIGGKLIGRVLTKETGYVALAATLATPGLIYGLKHKND